jgi:hypothetical protein
LAGETSTALITQGKFAEPHPSQGGAHLINAVIET